MLSENLKELQENLRREPHRYLKHTDTYLAKEGLKKVTDNSLQKTLIQAAVIVLIVVVLSILFK